MPTIKIPLADYTDFPELKKKEVKKKLVERIELYVRGKEIEARLPTLNFELFGELRSVLPEEVKSVKFEVDGEQYRVTTLANEAKSYFNYEAATTTEFKCPCCGKKRITVPAKVVDSFFKLGKTPSPTVSVTRIKDGNGDDE